MASPPRESRFSTLRPTGRLVARGAADNPANRFERVHVHEDRDWLDEAAGTRAQRQRLAAAADHWRELDGARDALWPARRLAVDRGVDARWPCADLRRHFTDEEARGFFADGAASSLGVPADQSAALLESLEQGIGIAAPRVTFGVGLRLRL